jgi:hypothetical protein
VPPLRKYREEDVSTTKRVRWACPNGCPAVLGPSRPRRDDVARYCLTCSAKRGRLVLRTAPSLEAKRESKAERAKAKKAAAAARAAAREAAREAARFAKLEAAAETRPRQEGVDYVIQVSDASAGDDTRTIATFGREDFARAFRTYQLEQQKDRTARLLKVYEGGWVMAPIVGYVQTRPARNPYSVVRNERGRYVIGWSRIEPVYRGTLRWRLETYERNAMLPGRIIVSTSLRPFRR